MADILVNCNFDIIGDFSNLDTLSCLFSAVVHDFKHPGYNNGFLINSKSALAYQFNGINLYFR